MSISLQSQRPMWVKSTWLSVTTLGLTTRRTRLSTCWPGWTGSCPSLSSPLPSSTSSLLLSTSSGSTRGRSSCKRFVESFCFAVQVPPRNLKSGAQNPWRRRRRGRRRGRRGEIRSLSSLTAALLARWGYWYPSTPRITFLKKYLLGNPGWCNILFCCSRTRGGGSKMIIWWENIPRFYPFWDQAPLNPKSRWSFADVFPLFG